MANKNKSGRKDLQLAKQVERAINEALGSSADPALWSMLVLGVLPAPDARTLQVVVTADADESDCRRVLAAYEGEIRSEVAAAIHRKRVPHLRFVVIGR